MPALIRSARILARRLARDQRGVQFIEFAYAIPIFVFLMLGGVEMANYILTKMRVSQIALQLADHASRMGSGSLLAAKTVTETQVNDVLTGGGLLSGELNLYQNGRVIVSDLEPVANPNTTNKYKIVWQRCRGSATKASGFGVTGATNLDGIGPSGQRVTAPNDSATMFVEVFYNYKPLFGASWAPSTTITEIASMTVRDRRDLTRIYNPDNVTISTC